VLARNGQGPISAETETEPEERFKLGSSEPSSPTPRLRPPVIRAELIGSDTCTALGITVRSGTPVCEMCRQLIEAGCDPATRLEAYRDTLCLRVRSIGEGSTLTVRAMGNGAPGFAIEGAPGRATGSPTRQTRRGTA
jgi:hypothetical protein